MRQLTVLLVIVSGCSAIELPRVSGETYYLWLGSAYSPIVQRRETRREGEGICFYMDGGKVQHRGFVTKTDLEGAASANHTLWMHAMVYQAAFADGMRKGIADGIDGSKLTSGQRDATAQHVPLELRRYGSQWVMGWDAGYGYGLYISTNPRRLRQTGQDGMLGLSRP